MAFSWTAHIHVNKSLSTLFLGKEHFPAVWPEKVQQTFQTLLSMGVLATVESFDGSANVLSLCLDTQSGRRELTAIMLDALQDHTKASQDQTKASQDQIKTHLSSFCQMREQIGSSAEVGPHSPQPKSLSVTQMSSEEAPSSTCQSISTEPVTWTSQLEKNIPAPNVPGW